VVLYSFSSILLRRLGHKDSTATIAFWFISLVGLSSGLLSIPGWRPLASEHYFWIVMLGVAGALGQALITAAFRRASVAVVAPFDYTHMIWAVIYGYFIWGYLPGLPTWIGSAILVATGLFILYRERRLMAKAKSIAFSESQRDLGHP
jgi:drug/metabolite transporter (DMT)-like permease